MHRTFTILMVSAVAVGQIGCDTTVPNQQPDAAAPPVDAANPVDAPTATDGSTASDVVYLFSSGDPIEADIRGMGPTREVRVNIDNVCENTLAADYPQFSCTVTRGLLSTGVRDEIRDFAGRYGVPPTSPVVGPNGGVISDTFSSLFDGLIERTLAEVGITGGPLFWAGSLSDGTIHEDYHCEYWTSRIGEANSQYALVARGDRTANWLFSNQIELCTASYPLLCVCW